MIFCHYIEIHAVIKPMLIHVQGFAVRQFVISFEAIQPSVIMHEIEVYHAVFSRQIKLYFHLSCSYSTLDTVWNI